MASFLTTPFVTKIDCATVSATMNIYAFKPKISLIFSLSAHRQLVRPKQFIVRESLYDC